MGRYFANRQAPYLWPSYLPDLTPCDFFLWGYIKQVVYDNRPQPLNLQELEERISQAFEDLPMEMIGRAIDCYERRLRRCIDVRGRSVEQEYGNFELIFC